MFSLGGCWDGTQHQERRFVSTGPCHGTVAVVLSRREVDDCPLSMISFNKLEQYHYHFVSDSSLNHLANTLPLVGLRPQRFQWEVDVAVLRSGGQV